MSIRREETAPELQYSQISSSWIPATPTKPGQMDPKLIGPSWQENRANPIEEGTQANLAVEANVSQPGKLTEDFLKEFDTWQAEEAANSRVHRENSCTNDRFSINGTGEWPNISFGTLLALAEANSNQAAIDNTSHNNFATSSCANRFTMSFGDSSQLDQGRANFDSELNIPIFATNGNSILSRHSFNLNAPPGKTTDEDLSKSASSQVEPITPEKTNKAKERQESTVRDSNIDVHAEKGKENTEDGVVYLHKDQEKSLVIDELCEETSKQLQENHKPDKGGTEEASLSKTPQQKPRRRKHRPKVIIEGKKKSTSVQKTSVPEETMRVKRKYVRKKGVNNPVGEQTNGTDLDNKTPSPTETSVVKRKYGRRKRDEEKDKGTSKAKDIKPPRYPLRSCRRSLNFNSDGQVIDGNSSYCPSPDFDRESHAQKFNAQEMEETFRKNDAITSQALTHPMNQKQEDYLSGPEQHSWRPLPSDTPKNSHTLTDQIVCTRGKCQIVFSDFTHDKEANIVQVSMHPNGQLTPKSPSDIICRSTCLTPEKQERILKRKSINSTDEAKLCNRNETGAFYNSLQSYVPIFLQNADKIDSSSGLHFPPIYKKKRTEKVYSTVTSSTQIKASTSDNHVKLERHTLGDSCTMLFTSNNLGSFGGLGHVNNLLTSNHVTYGTQNGRQVFEDLLALGTMHRIKKRRSNGPTRLRDVASLLEELPASRGIAAATSRLEGTEILHEPHTCTEALVADTRSTMVTKKRSKRNMLINSKVQNLYNHHMFATTSTGPLPLALTWKSMSPVDSIIEQLNQLDLNAESSLSSERNYNALMAYRGYYQEQHALVPFQYSAAIIPFDSSFDQVRRRRPRPKVDLDDETTRVWKLLLENINSEGIDGTDEEKTKWWEEERRVFKGRADSFIARMHLVQGDRRFSPWKGSVVDSVVGVFLTQNVSDHLSSSAFMSLAARYPLKLKIHQAELHEERLGTNTNDVLDCDGTFELNREVLNQPLLVEHTKIVQDFEDDRSREGNSVKSSGNTLDGFIIKDGIRGQSTDIFIHGPVISSEIATNKSSLIEDGRDTEDTLSSLTAEISSQNSTNFPNTPTAEQTDSHLQSTSEEEPTVGVKPKRVADSFVRLLQMAGSVLEGDHEIGSDKKMFDENHHVQLEGLASNLHAEDSLCNPTFSAKTSTSFSQSTLCPLPDLGAQAKSSDLSQGNSKFSNTSSIKELCTAEISELSSESACGTTYQKITVNFEEDKKISCPNAHSNNIQHIEVNEKIVGIHISQGPAQNKMQGVSHCPTDLQNSMDATGSTSNTDNLKNLEHKEVNSNKNDLYEHPSNMVNGPKAKGGRPRKEKENQVDWDQLRKQTHSAGRERPRTPNTLDSVDWDAVRSADVNDIAQTIKERGMNNMLAERIKDFLERIVRDHGSIDLEWLRDIPPDKAKEYLLSIRGLGLKSVECVRLLTLHHLAFPVDTNVGRIAVRLGWVPLQPLPESLQLHLLELYPVLESIQKYLWPRLCKLDQKTLYELHYQMITFGKVFCTKNKPNCNACPMRGECRHFASAFASARLALPAPQEESIVSATENRKPDQIRNGSMNALQLPSTQSNEMNPTSGVRHSQPIIEEPPTPEPIIEVPATPEQEQMQVLECDIENTFVEDPEDIPTIQLNMEEFTHNLQAFMQKNTELQEGDMSKALVALTSEAASIPMPKLKNVSRLRTEHQVYELPDSHPLLEGMDKREPDDPCPYLLAIWTPGETMDSIEPPERQCSSQGFEKLCSDETCSSCNSIREADSQTVRGTLLIPCRTAMRGSFPLNGTYFQVNEVFSDHESSLSPIDVPRHWLWNLPRRTVYFGTSIPTIFKGLSTEGIQYCFWRGFVCVRGFDRRTRAPRPLIARLHFPASKLVKGKGKIDENHT